MCVSLLSKETDLCKNKSSGINKLMIIGLGLRMTESYHNLSLIFSKLDLQSVCGVCCYSFAADFKMIMILLGITRIVYVVLCYFILRLCF